MLMRTKSVLLALSACLLLLSSHVAGAQVIVRGGIAIGPRPYPRPHYGRRYYYPRQPAVVYAVPPPPVYYAPQPVYYAPRPVYYAPRPVYYGRGHGLGHGRRW